tara:strand:+ start:56791 stop:62259 length:5469 start_codon:yes stop_codon:yes gene_type:complete
MKTILTFLLFLVSFNSIAVNTDGYDCELVYRKCTDNGSRDVNGTQMYLSDIPGGAEDNCWVKEKVYRCVEEDWTTQCKGTSQDGVVTNNTNGAAYPKVWGTPKYVKYKSLYPGGGSLEVKNPNEQDVNVNEKSNQVYIQTYSANPYVLSCPSSSVLNNMATSPQRQMDEFSSFAISRDCAADPDWHVTDSNTFISDNFAGHSWSFNIGLESEHKSHWICVTDVSNDCTADDIANCDVLGYEGVGEENPSLPSIEPCGRYESCTEYRECEQDVTTTCDPEDDVLSCSAPFSANPIPHPEFPGESIGTESKYTCYDMEDVPEVCSAPDEAPGFEGCHHSYFVCNEEYDYSIDPTKNIHNDVDYGYCPSWTDYYVCPDAVVVDCPDDMNSCGEPVIQEQTNNSGGDIVYWETDHVCYNGDINDSCDNPDGHEFYGCVKVGATCMEYDTENHSDPNWTGTSEYGQCVKWRDDYVCPSEDEYNCDRDPEYEDCRPKTEREGSRQDSGDYDGPNDIYFDRETTGYIDDYVCWNGEINEVCDIDENVPRQECDWNGYTCHAYDEHKAQPNLFDDRDYGTCVDWTDSWICNSAKTTECDGEYDECGPMALMEGLDDDVHQCFLDWQENEADYEECVYNGGAPSECRSSYPELVCAENEGDSRVYSTEPTGDPHELSPQQVLTDWAEQFICYTGDYIESCEDKYDPNNLKECEKTGFTCLVDDPLNKDPDPDYGTCKTWIDRYVCGSEQYTECDTEFEMCHSKTLEEYEENEDGEELFRREVEFCYTDEYNESLCALEDDECFLYDDAVACEQQTLIWEEDYAQCLENNDSTYCDSNYPEPTCKTQVECPTGQRPGTNCQLDWDAYDAAMDTCLADGTKTVSQCEEDAPLPNCDLVEKDYIDCEWSGFSCESNDPFMTDEQMADNNFDGRNYGNCVKWEDRYVCPQNQWQDCMGSVDADNECGPLGYVEIYNEQDGQATDYITKLECVSDPNLPECQVDPSCTLLEVECTESDESLCTKKKQIYTCAVNRDDCVEYELTCQNPIDYGLTLDTENPNDLGAFIATASTAKMIADNSKLVAGDIQIFSGQHKRCRKMDYGNVQAMIAAAMVIIYWTGDVSLLNLVLYWSALLAIDYDCCKIDNTMAPDAHGTGIDGACDPNAEDSDCSGYDGGILEMLRCDEEETELSKSRGAKTTVGDFGQYCTVDVLGFCLERGYSYCEFDNIFSRIVQEQGRDQIADALTSGAAGAAEEDFSFNYSTSIVGGAWNVVSGSDGVNGNKIAMWSWDEDCINHQVDTNPPEDVDDYLPPLCPYSDEVHIAVCMSGTACTTLPDSPYTQYNTSAGYEVTSDYKVKIADPNSLQNFALSPTVFISGQCGTTVVSITNQVMTWNKDYLATNEELQLVVPQNIYNGGDLIATVHKVHVNWGDGRAEDMELDGSVFKASHPYLFESSFSGRNVGVVITATNGETFSTGLNVLIRDDATSNPNDNSEAGELTISAAGTAVTPDQCNYKFSAYPYGAGASTSIGYDLNWINGVYIDPSASDQIGQWSEFEYDVGPHIVIPYELKDVDTSSTTVRIKIDGTEYSLPKDTGGSEVTVGPLRFNGACNDKYKSCTYRAFRDITLEMMDWGEQDNPNCRGFYVEEIDALDFGRMDLSEWIATIMPKTELTEQEKEELTEEAIADAETWEAAIAADPDQAFSSDGEAKVVFFNDLVSHPRDTVKFRVAEVVHVNQDYSFDITQVRVNWGDGTTFEEQFGGNYTFTRQYNKESGKNGFLVNFALTGNLDGTEVLYETSVRILVGYAPNKNEMMDELGGGVINIKEFSRLEGRIDGQ